VSLLSSPLFSTCATLPCSPVLKGDLASRPSFFRLVRCLFLDPVCRPTSVLFFPVLLPFDLYDHFDDFTPVHLYDFPPDFEGTRSAPDVRGNFTFLIRETMIHSQLPRSFIENSPLLICQARYNRRSPGSRPPLHEIFRSSSHRQSSPSFSVP